MKRIQVDLIYLLGEREHEFTTIMEVSQDFEENVKNILKLTKEIEKKHHLKYAYIQKITYI